MPAQVWTLENATPRFEDALKYAKENNECLCLQDAISQTGIPYSTFFYLVEHHDYLDSLKRDIMHEIIRRINKNALAKKEPASAAASIWRMKQLGEKDQQYIDQKQTGITQQIITVASDKTKKETEKLLKKFQDEIKKTEK